MAVAGMTMLASSEGEAQEGAKKYCLPSGKCFAAAFTFDYLVPGIQSTDFRFSVIMRSLAGVGEAPFGLGFFGLVFPGSVANPECAHDADGCVWGRLENRTAIGNVRHGPQTAIQNDQSLDKTYSHDFMYGIGEAGCELGDAETYGDWASQICDATGFNGWMRYDYSMIRHGTDTRMLGFDEFTYLMGASPGYSTDLPCAFTGSGVSGCTVSPYATVTPEPVTMTLMATGLVGVLAAVRRRKSRANGTN